MTYLIYILLHGRINPTYAAGMGLLAACLLVIPAEGQEKQQFTLDLNQAVNIALKQNESVLIAQKDQDKASQQIRETRAESLPQLNASFGYDRNWKLPNIIFDTPEGRQSFTVGAHNNYSGTVSLRQALYAGGKVGAGLRGATLFKDLSQENMRAVKQQIQSTVEMRFYDVLLAGELVQVNDLAMRHARANLAHVTSLHKGGRVSEYDLLRAKVQVGNLRPDSLRVSNTYAQAKTYFKDAIGIDPDAQITLLGEFRADTALDLDNVESLIQLGLQQRADVRQMQLQIKMEREQVKVAKAASRPSVDLVASNQIQAQSNELVFARDEARSSWTTGLIVQVPLFDGLRTRAKVAQAHVDVRRRELEIDQLNRQIRAEIRQAWLDLQEARERLKAQQGNVEQAEKGMQIATSRYGNGVGTQLEVMDAQLSFTQAKIEYVRAQRDIAVELVALEQAVGHTRPL